ncbi:MAG: CRISPR-associated DxTHG motif protein [Caldilineaceae bacterium]|nr:CRISPR-associated DxTHG motif protein [Caldilineaceae bacterium]
MTPANQSDHLMLTVLGTNPQPARYVLGECEYPCVLAPVALLKLLPEAERPDRVLAVCTPEAKKETWPKLQKELPDQYQAELVEIPNGGELGDVNQFLKKVMDAIPENVELTVDITHGFRHFSFLTHTAVLYMAALRGIRVRGAYYGMLNRNAPSRFLNLRPLLELPRWTHALEVLRETGSALPLASLIGAVPWRNSQFPNQLSDQLKGLSEAYLSGLPLELGEEAGQLKEHDKELGKLLRAGQLPLERELRAQLQEMLEPQALLNKPPKSNVPLSKDELTRQAHIIDSLLDKGHTATALGLMREWTVSWVIYRQNPGADWLDHNAVRRQAENLLRSICTLEKDNPAELFSKQRKLAKFWRELTDLRNGFAHHGMRRQALVNDRKTNGQIGCVRKYWKTTLRSLPEFSLSLGASKGGRVLVSPIGQSPGVLFSAVKAYQSNENGAGPTLCLIICSDETKGLIAEALQQAGYGGEVATLLLKDALAFEKKEFKRLVKKAQQYLIGADEVAVNVTGGTTVMGLLADRLASEARRFARPTRRFGLIDRRARTEQGTDPYQTGEAFWLDTVEGADGND